MKRVLIAALTLLALAGCGSRKDLALKPGQTPAPVARGAERSQTPDEMTRFETQARPDRSGEPILKSQERRDDTFDLPPS
ncbi:MAG: hypothetical protein U1E68_08725 [Sphingomonadaceae bacterium]|jgi:predicted small lipoprotein YifL